MQGGEEREGEISRRGIRSSRTGREELRACLMLDIVPSLL